MNTQATTDADKRHHFPSEIIAHGVWLYFRFCLSYRDGCCGIVKLRCFEAITRL